MHVGLYAFGGLSTSPRTEMKFERQSIDPINGNDLVNKAFGGVPSKSARRCGIFESFFGFQDPRLLLPSKNNTQNSRLTHFQAYISIVQFNVGSWRKISFDEATCGYKGKHILKSVIKFNKEGDGYLLYCIGDDGFIYTFSLQTTTASKKWVDKGSVPHMQEFYFCLSSSPVSFTYDV